MALRPTIAPSAMEFRRLGKTGLKVSALSFGIWTTIKSKSDLQQAKDLIKAARDADINFFDNAEVYANGEAEAIMGQAFKDLGLKRSDLVLSTKIMFGGFGPNDIGLSRKRIVEGTRASLARLQTDYVDLLLCHRPDPDTPIEETVRAMDHLVDRGMALYWGTSEWSRKQIQEAQAIADSLGAMPPVVEQPEYNLFERRKVEEEYLPLYDSRMGMGLTVWSPLASGILTGKYGTGTAPDGTRLSREGFKTKLDTHRAHIEAASRLEPIAKELGCSLAQLALAWVLKNPHVSTAITGATRVSQLQDNVGALQVVPKLTEEVMAPIEEAVRIPAEAVAAAAAP